MKFKYLMSKIPIKGEINRSLASQCGGIGFAFLSAKNSFGQRELISIN